MTRMQHANNCKLPRVRTYACLFCGECYCMHAYLPETHARECPKFQANAHSRVNSLALHKSAHDLQDDLDRERLRG